MVSLSSSSSAPFAPSSLVTVVAARAARIATNQCNYKKKLTTLITQLHQINGTFLCCVFVVVVFVVVNEDNFVVVVVPSSLLPMRTCVFKKAFSGIPNCFYNYVCCFAITCAREYHCWWYVFLTLHCHFVCLTCLVFLFFVGGNATQWYWNAADRQFEWIVDVNVFSHLFALHVLNVFSSG